MKYKNTTAFLLTFTILCGLCSCGKNASSSKTESTIPGSEISGGISSETEPLDNENSSAASDEKNIEDDNNENTNASKSTAANPDSKNKPAATTSAAISGNSSLTTTASKNESGNLSGITSSPEENQGSSNSSHMSTEAIVKPAKNYTAEITLGVSASAKGDNVTVDGSSVTITGGGTYFIKGSASQGQIIVDTVTEEKLKLILSGVTLSNSSGPAIFINEAKRCTIELENGTVSTLKDGGKDKINDGVIFSNDTLHIKGNGTLNITSGNAHGIASDDDIIIEDGYININSVKSGIFAHDDITVKGGNINIKGGTNGLKSKGTIHIEGGHTVASGGTKEEKSAVYAASGFAYTGGMLISAGNQVTKPSSSSNPFAIIEVGGSASAGTKATVSLNGKQIETITPPNYFRYIIVLSPELKSGGKFTVDLAGKTTDFTINDGFNHFIIDQNQ